MRERIDDMELYIIRHAESENNARPLEERVADPPLSEMGRRQAERLAPRIQHIQPTRLYVSPFRRALETMAPYMKIGEVMPEAWCDLHEQGGVMHGVSLETFEGWPGMTRDEMLAAFPAVQLPDDIDHRGWWKCRPYEPIERAVLRAERVAVRLREDFAHTDERVVLITHGLFMSLLISALMGLPWAGYDRFGDIANTAVTRFTVTREYNRLGLLNCVRHLPEEWITGADPRHFRTSVKGDGREG